MLKNCLTIVILITAIVQPALCQNTLQGTPFIQNYASTDYQFHPKNFAITQDKRGMMYFANAYGILEYDGNTWRQINLPDGKSAISFAHDEEGRIYVGSVGEIGFLEADSMGSMRYHSLLHKMPPVNNLGEVQKIFILKNIVVVSSYTALVALDLNDGRNTKVFYPSPGMAFDYTGEIDDRIYVRESGKGLLALSGNDLSLVPLGEQFARRVIHLMVKKGDITNILTHDGYFEYNERKLTAIGAAVTSFIRQNEIQGVISMPDGRSAICTANTGILFIDANGNLLQHITKRNGLCSDNILGLFCDDEQNIWAATDNGISYIQTSAPFASIGEQDQLEGMGYASYIHQGNLYLGTSRGLFYKKWVADQNPLDPACNYKLVEGTDGQVWTIGEAGGALLCGHNLGLFHISGNKAIKISPSDYTGGWVFSELKNTPYLLLGTYQGLEVYEQKHGQWKFKNKIKGFDESSRTLGIDDDHTIWVCHGNKGLFRLRLNASLDSAIEVTNLALKQNFAPDYFNDIARINDQLVFAGENLVYVYDPVTQKLEKHNTLNRSIGPNVLISKISEQPDKSIWLVNNDVIEILIPQADGTYTKNKKLLRKLKGQLIGSYEYFWRNASGHYFFGTQNGFVHFNPALKQTDKSFHTVIRKAESINHTRSHELPVYNPDGVKLPYAQNSLRFSYTALFYEDQEKTQYQYALSKAGSTDVEWSSWTTETYKEFTNITEGNYVFRVRAANIYDHVSEEAAYTFTVLAPWYRSAYAYTTYLVLLVLLLGVTVKLIRLKIRKEKLRVKKEKEKEILLMEKQFAEEALKNEREIILLQNEKLEAEVKYKNDALAHLASNLTQKSEFLSHLKKELATISRDNHSNQHSLQELIRTIDRDTDFDDGWNHFQESFDVVHHNFLYKLRERFPALKSTDLLLCAYIKMNRSNKEIASLLNISVSAVEKRRFRLREKLKLDNDTRLTEFLLEV